MSTGGEGGQQELSRASERPPSGPLEADPVVQVPAPESPVPVECKIEEGGQGGVTATTSQIKGGGSSSTGYKRNRSPSSISPKATDSTTDEYESSTTGDSHQTSSSRQVIAVSASKGPAAFFNLARKFLITDEVVDLSALEGAIVSAVDAAHLLERSKLASIVRIHTSYVSVEPKRKRQDSTSEEPSPRLEPQASPYPHTSETTAHAVSSSERQDTSIYTYPKLEASSIGDTIAGQRAQHQQQQQQQQQPRAKGGSPLKRARIIITVKRTPEYKRWLDENPKQAIIAAAGGDDENIVPHPTGAPPRD